MFPLEKKIFHCFKKKLTFTAYNDEGSSKVQGDLVPPSKCSFHSPTLRWVCATGTGIERGQYVRFEHATGREAKWPQGYLASSCQCAWNQTQRILFDLPKNRIVCGHPAPLPQALADYLQTTMNHKTHLGDTEPRCLGVVAKALTISLSLSLAFTISLSLSLSLCLPLSHTHTHSHTFAHLQAHTQAESLCRRQGPEACDLGLGPRAWFPLSLSRARDVSELQLPRLPAEGKSAIS